MIEMPTFDLSGRTAVVTGGGGRIGRAVAEAMIGLGATVISVDLEPVTSVTSDRLIPLTGDVASRELWLRVKETANRTSGRVDAVVHAAALVGLSDLQGWSVPYEQQDPDLWARVFEVNVTSVFGLLQTLDPLLRERGASVVLLSSIYASLGPDMRIYERSGLGNPAGYAASKGALESMTRWLATTLAPDVRVNAISLGGVESGQPEEFVKRYSDRVPMGRMARTLDVVGPVLFLVGNSARYITGSVIPVDGGLAVW